MDGTIFRDDRMNLKTEATGAGAAGRHGDELPLAQLAQILSRRKVWVVAATVLFTLFGAVYALFKPPVYEVSARLRVGQLAGAGFFEPPAVLSSRLVATYGETIADGVKRKRPFLRAAVSRAIPGAVDITVEGDRPEDAVAFLESVTSEIQRKHGDGYKISLDAIRARIDAIASQEASLKKQGDDLSELIERLKRSDPVQASLLALERSRTTAMITDLESERLGLIQKLAPPLTEQTAVLGQIVAPIAPAPPGRTGILLLSVLVGIAAGALIAIVAEALATARPGTSGTTP